MTNRKKYEAQRLKIMKRQQEILKKLEQEPKVEVIFQNLEDPVDVEFTYQGVKKYVLKHGQSVKLPMSVLKHLMSLKVPVYQYETDPQTGQLKPSKKVAEWRNRFAFVPVDTDALAQVENQ